MIAVAVAFQGTWCESNRKYRYRSQKFKRQRHATVLAHRGLIAALLVATIIAVLSPLKSPPALVQGVILTALFMAPVMLFVLLPAYRASADKSKPDKTLFAGSKFAGSKLAESKSAGTAEQRVKTNPAPKVSAVRANANQRVDLWLEPSSSDVKPPTSETASTRRSAPRTSSKKMYDSADPVSTQDGRDDADSGLDETLSLDQTLSLEQQMENIDDAVLHLDLGLDGYTDIYSDPVDDGLSDHDRATNTAIAMARDSIRSGSELTQSSGGKMLARSYGELTELVAGLHKDKIRLQKLVIAQKAVLDAEKQSHQKTRVLAKDAMTVMRKARDGQRVAEKLARRERSERKRLEADYVKVRKQLENALSTRPKSVIDI